MPCHYDCGHYHQFSSHIRIFYELTCPSLFACVLALFVFGFKVSALLHITFLLDQWHGLSYPHSVSILSVTNNGEIFWGFFIFSACILVFLYLLSLGRHSLCSLLCLTVLLSVLSFKFCHRGHQVYMFTFLLLHLVKGC